MFCDVALAARIEAAEARLVAEAAASVTRRVADASVIEVGGGVAAFTEAGSPLNKVAGLGFAALAAEAWTAVELEHARRGAPIQVELSTLADPQLATFLCARGYRLVGVENVSGSSLASPPAPGAPDIAIEVVASERLQQWLDVMVSGFGAADAGGAGVPESFDAAVVERVVRDFATARGVTLFLARRNGEPAGAASMRIDTGIAQLCGAATLPSQRRRGVQSALLRHRLRHAAAAGCDVGVVTTQPGSKSQQNVQALQFSLLYARNVFVREPEHGSSSSGEA
jgi:GNAT superfamily N-acetyltransferase